AEATGQSTGTASRTTALPSPPGGTAVSPGRPRQPPGSSRAGTALGSRLARAPRGRGSLPAPRRAGPGTLAARRPPGDREGRPPFARALASRPPVPRAEEGVPALLDRQGCRPPQRGRHGPRSDRLEGRGYDHGRSAGDGRCPGPPVVWRRDGTTGARAGPAREVRRRYCYIFNSERLPLAAPLDGAGQYRAGNSPAARLVHRTASVAPAANPGLSHSAPDRPQTPAHGPLDL